MQEALDSALADFGDVQVPTVAIETVYVWNNTSIVQDEVLAQRLGLIPLDIDPRKLQMKQCELRARPDAFVSTLTLVYATAPEDAPTDLNTVVFNLVARCERRKDVRKGETESDKIWHGSEGTNGAPHLDHDKRIRV